MSGNTAPPPRKSDGLAKEWLPVLTWLLPLAFLYTWIGSRNFMWEWDERFYVLVARNLMKHPLTPTLIDFEDAPVFPLGDWMHAHVWLHKPPLSGWLGALGMAILGIRPIGYHLPGIGLALGSVGFTYAALRLLGVSRLLSSFFTLAEGTSTLVLQLVAGHWGSIEDLSLFASLHAGFYLVLRYLRTGKGACWLGLACGLGYLGKSAPALLPLLILLLVRPKSLGWLKAGVVSVLIILPWTIYTNLMWPEIARHEAGFGMKHLWQVIEGHRTKWTYYFLVLPHYTNLAFVALGLAWTISWVPFSRTKREPESWVIFLFFTIPFWVFSLAKSSNDSYLGTMIQPLFVGAATLTRFGAPRRQIIRRVLSASLLLLFLSSSILNVTTELFSASSPQQAARIACVREINTVLGRTAPGEKWVLMRTGDFWAESFMTFGDFLAYEWDQPTGVIENLRAAGYSPLALDEEIQAPCQRTWLETDWSTPTLAGRIAQWKAENVYRRGSSYSHHGLPRKVSVLIVIVLFAGQVARLLAKTSRVG